MTPPRLVVPGIALALACTSALRAQWVTFRDETATRLVAAAGVGAADPEEKDFAWADFDKDGDIDLVCVRKEPFTSSGRFPNVLFMNENGVLTDRTAALASASTVPGSSGFLDATNDRDVVVVDVNGDTWLDLVTATTLSAGQPQYIRVPRVYINQGLDPQNVWQGFLYDDATRIDDIASGWQGVHRFCSVSAGDIDGDGDQDLYFGDYEQGGNRPIDINDRLLINDGTGYFTDQSAQRMSVTMLESSFAMSTGIADMNLDGKLDIVKDDALNAPQGISISYNDGSGGFGFFGTYAIVYSVTPYHFAIGDLNNDALPDMVVTDDSDDRYQLHAGVVNGVATFAPSKKFSFTGGGADDGFGGNNFIADLNNDGWNDVIITDIDVDIAGYNRRCHIYRNLGDAPDVTLQEQQQNGEVCGIPTGELVASHDVAVFDIDGDGWLDMVLGRAVGLRVFMNDPPIGMTLAYPAGLIVRQAPGSVQTLYVAATGIGGVQPMAGTGVLHYSINGAPFQSSPMRDEGPGQFSVKLPRLLTCGDKLRYYLAVDDTLSNTYLDPPTGPADFYESVGATGEATAFEDNFEGAPNGWIVVNDPSLTAGAWEIADPNVTVNLGQVAAPFDDAEGASASFCFVTENGPPGAQAFQNDVDGGPTDLISPPFDLQGSDGFVSYARWFYSDNGDTLEVAISPDGTPGSWVTVETVSWTAGVNAWNVVSFRVSDYITPSANVRVRFRTADLGTAGVTEAGVDVFHVTAYLCECAPICQLDVGLQGPGTATFNGFIDTGGAGPPSVDFVVEGAPPAAPGWILASFDLDPAPAFGGSVIDLEPFVILPFLADAQGSYGLYGVTGGFGPLTFYAQSVYLQAGLPQGVGITNGLRIEFP
ncbi:MAG: VCBS repeat-containing protein [Planctomycetes bacterium]|nr:VCBS repeat-containing protein [Planctomycetota bacterium]